MRQIKASEVKPGMKIQFDLEGWDVKGTVSRVEPTTFGLEFYTAQGEEMTLDEYTPVTVVSEPAPAQPEEPTEFGAKVVAGGCQFVLINTALHQWSDITGLWNPWREVCARGPVTVVPDQGWTVPADAPEVPERIEEWPEDDTALRWEVWLDANGDRLTWNPTWDDWECRDRVTDVHKYSAQYPRRGPWTRDTNA